MIFICCDSLCMNILQLAILVLLILYQKSLQHYKDIAFYFINQNKQ